MAYCTLADVYLEAGTSVGTATDDDVTNMIIRSDEEIVAILIAKNVSSIPLINTNLKTASIQFTIAKIKRRQAEELSRPGTLSIGNDISFSVNPEKEAQAAEAKANAAISRFIATAESEYTGIGIIQNPDDPFLDLR